MSNDLNSVVDVTPDPEKQKWIVKLKVVLGVLGEQGGKLKPVDSKVSHLSQRLKEDLELSRANVEKRSEELKRKWRESQIDDEKLREKEARELKLKQDAIRNGESKLTVGKSLKSGSFGSVSFLESDTGVPLVVKTPTSEKYRKELETEAEVYAKIGDHPNIVKCYGMLDTGNGNDGLVLERIQGCVEITDTFNQLNDKYAKGQLSYDKYIGTIQSIMRQMLSGLAKMEECGLSHNDIKDDNVMLDAKTGTVKLIDIGLATEHGQDSKQGHPMYQAPENVKGEKSSDKHDSYSAGAMLQKFTEGSIRIMTSKKSAESSEMPIDVAEGEFGGRKSHGASRETEYVRFVNALSHPDPEKRLTPSQALAHPFLSESLLSDEEAAKMLASMYETQVDRRENAFDTVDELSSEGWVATYDSAVKENAVPEAVSLSVALEKGLVKFEELVDQPLDRATALKAVIDGFKRLLAVGGYADHPLMQSYLTARIEDARREVQACHEKAGVNRADIEFPIGDREFSAAGWGTAYAAAVESGAVEPEPKLAGAIRDSFGGLRMATQAFESRKSWQETYDSAKFGEDCLTNLTQHMGAIRNTPGFGENRLMIDLLDHYDAQVVAARTEFKAFVDNPAPFQVVEGFTGDAFRKTCQNAVDAMAAPNQKREFEAIAEPLSTFEAHAKTAKHEKETMVNRASAAHDAAGALGQALKAINSLTSAFRQKSVKALTAYFEVMRKDAFAKQKEYQGLAEWFDSLVAVKGLDDDQETQGRLLLAAEAYKRINDEFNAFERIGNWDQKVEAAAKLVNVIEELQEELKDIRESYPDALETQVAGIADKLKAVREFPESGTPFRAVLRFNAKSCRETYDRAMSITALPPTDQFEILTGALKDFEAGAESYRDESLEWDQRDGAGRSAIEALEAAAEAVRNMQAIDVYAKNIVMSGYLKWMAGAIEEDLKLLNESFKLFSAIGASVEVTANFRDHWRNAKSAAEEIFKRVAPGLAGVRKGVKFSKHLPLKSGLGSALKDFENAVETNARKASDKNAEKVRKYLAQIEKLVSRHCARLLLEPKKIQPNKLEPQDQYWLPLMKGLNEITKGVQSVAAG